MIKLSAVEKTALLTACKRREIDPTTYSRLSQLFPDLIVEVDDHIEHDDIYSLELQIRQILIEEAVLKVGGDVIVELGCGLSSLGRDVGNTLDADVLEVDLPGIMEIRERAFSHTHSDKIKLLSGDVLNGQLWKSVREAVPKGARVCVVCEGLLRYFPMNEKRFIAEKVFDLTLADGFWISCDVTLTEMLKVESSNPDIRDRELASTVLAGASNNSFASKADCISFFAGLGFSVDLLSAVDALPSLLKHLPRCSYEDILEASRFVNILTMTNSQ
ncbi:hypothetical protein [Roseovarius ramblicola]|uniref:Class I SAM-dependent methyltransferase n=1 Tax=Roseovarius ramblicola TaxID=2022336 RepID=A0ABV5HYK2_9RHOB